MPFSQMLSPVWQMIKTLDAATDPKDSSRSASPKVTTILHQPGFAFHWRTKELTSRHSRSVGSREPLCGSVHKLSTLAVTRHNNLGRRATRRSLVDQVEHCRCSSSVTTSQKSENIGWVVHSLDGQTGCASKTASQCVEEGWALGACFANVTGTVGSACPDDSYGTASGTLLSDCGVIEEVRRLTRNRR
jgi:hypothetical protein